MTDIFHQVVSVRLTSSQQIERINGIIGEIPRLAAGCIAKEDFHEEGLVSYLSIARSNRVHRGCLWE